MTAYHGGKQRIGKKIADIIYNTSLDIEDKYDFTIKGYCEPFCGMLGVYQHIPELFENHTPKLKYKAGDINKSVIMMWQKAQKGWTPPIKTNEKEYNKLKDSKDSALRGYIGHQYSFGGQFFNGYAPKYGKTKNSKASENVINISEELYDVQFKNGDYTQYSHLKGYIIYCDPPYENTHHRYRDQKDRKFVFDSDLFWKWCKHMSKYNILYVSSYNAPKGVESTDFSSTYKLTGISPRKNNKQRTEKLYMLS